MRTVNTHRAIAIVWLLSVAGCRHSPPPQPRWHVRFGPVISSELIVGHATARAEAWLMTSADALVRVDLDDGGWSSRKLEPLEPGEHVWGLAVLSDGTMWTLLGRSVLGQVSPQGRVLRRIPLAQPHVGIFGGGRELLYQVMNLDPPADALVSGPPGEAARHRWGQIRTRRLPLDRGAVAALNLVACGHANAEAIPCWFPDLPAVTVTDRTGGSRELRLEGLPTVAPELLLAAANPRRPVRDAAISPAGFLWVLGSGTPPPGAANERAGGWVLARYRGDGAITHRMQLREPARVLLSAADDFVVLLSSGGFVVEVRP